GRRAVERSGSPRPSRVAGLRGWSRGLRRLQPRLTRGDRDSRCLPRCAEDREQVAVESDVPGRLPGQDQEEAEQEEDRVRARATSEHEVEVHERAADCGDADERTEDETDADGSLAERDELAEEALHVADDQELGAAR